MLKKIGGVFLTLCLVLSMLITLPFKDLTVFAKSNTNDEIRYSVLVLDVSGSMSGTPISVMKQAAQKFCSSVLNGSGSNYVAIVSYSSLATIKCQFTDDYTTLYNSINSLSAYGTTNVQDALVKADQLLDSVTNDSDVIKNIILLSDGLPCEGRTEYSGQYSDSDYYDYMYANSAYTDAKSISNEGTNIYTLGFFHELYGSELQFGQRFLSDLQNSGYYNVEDPEDLSFVFGEIAGLITKVNGTFMYPCKNADYSAEFFYDDNYFTKSSYSGYNEHLSTMSLCLELSIWPSIPYVDNGNYAGSSVNAEKLLSSIGFEKFHTNSMYQVKPTEDSIGVGIAQKKIYINNEEVTLLAVAVRGGGYEKEWASNFKIGANGDAVGFTEAKNSVLNYIREYISSYDVSGHIKFWVVGYSRGGATANLTGAALDDGITYPNCTYDANDVFCYTFEAPMGTANSSYNSEKYLNIHNIINPNDVVPMVAPDAWSFHRYGHDYVLPTAVTSGNSAVNTMLEKYNTLTSTNEYLNDKNDKYFLDDFQDYYVKVDGWSILPGGDPFISIAGTGSGSQEAFLSQFMNKFANVYVGSRKNYYNYYQSHVTYLMGTVMGLTSAQLSDVVDTAKPKFQGFEWASILMPVYSPNLFKYGFDPQNREDQVYKNIAKRIGDSLNANGIDYNQSKLNDACVYLLDLIMATGTNEINDAVTLFQTVSSIGNAHYPELCLAWLQSQDSYYTPQGRANFNAGGYRIIRINCPVDVKVYDSECNLVAYVSDINESKQEYELVCEINSNGEKVVYIPIDSEYTFELIATGEGNVSVSIDEVNALSGQITKIQTFEDIVVKTGDIITGILPAYSEEDLKNLDKSSSVLYTMTDSENANVNIDTLKNDEDANEYYIVKFADTNEDTVPLGILTGSGTYTYGSFAQVEAIVADGCKFEGWYVNNELVSNDAKYRFKVIDDIELEARFLAGEISLTVNNNSEGGSITGIETGKYSIGSIYEINAVAKDGYQFIGWETDNVIIENEKSANTRIIIPSVDAKISAVFKPIPVNEIIDSSDNNTISSTNNNNMSSPETGDSFNRNLILLMAICTSLSFIICLQFGKKFSKNS